jgi:DNA-binding NtrC family response regulator
MEPGAVQGNAAILIVDDDNAVLSTLKALVGSRCRVLTASSAAQASVVLNSHPIQVVVSDYRMPGQNGLSFLMDVKKNYPGTIRVLMTAFADMDLVVRALNEGEIHRFLSKPFKSFEFNDIINDCLRLARIHEDGPDNPTKSRTLLIAHDSAITLSTLRVLLRPSYRILTTSNGLEALSLVSANRIDALVLGIGLAMLDGCTISSYLKTEAHVSFPIVFWSGDISPAVEQHLRDSGADHVFDEASPEASSDLKRFLARQLGDS